MKSTLEASSHRIVLVKSLAPVKAGGEEGREVPRTLTSSVFRLPSMCRREMKFTENKTIMEERRGGVGRKEIFPVEER
jgi:hypothetical protein